MHLIPLLVVVCLSLLHIQSAQGGASAGLKSKHDCGPGALAYIIKKIQPPCTSQEANRNRASRRKCRQRYVNNLDYVDKYRQRRALVFNNDYVFIKPERPKIPGCFNLTAYGVQIRRPLKNLVAEFHMTLGGDHPNYDEDYKLACKQKSESDCACGAKDACMYCDFCRNFNNHIPLEATEHTENQVIVKNPERKSVTITKSNESPRDDVCNCNIEKGIYDINAEICTPDREDLEKTIPAAVLDNYDNGISFTLWTTLYIYTTRFQNLNIHISDHVISKMKEHHLGGCSIIGTNLDID